MCAGGIIIAVLVFVVIIVYFTSSGSSQQKEEFGDLLGALAPYQKQMVQALNNSNRQAVDRRLQPMNNWNAGEYIQSTFTQMRRDGVPPEEPRTDLKDCEKQCSGTNDPLSRDKCVSMCNCHANVSRFCETQCQYSLLPEDDCRISCELRKRVNCNNTSWNYMFGDMV